MPVIRASLLAVLALIGLALALDLARAQDPTTETGTTLHPGVNLIGWTAEPTPTSQLFREIPQLEAIWAWDAELDDWIVAARGAPEWLGGLGRVTPGMGLRMQLGGNEPYLWQRSTEPTRGLVKLRTGWNLVAWSGADHTPINDALKGIGWSLRTVHRWNPATQQWSTWTSPERTAQLIAADNTDQETNDDSETPVIRRGEALWINVARAVNWLQPTDLLPRLIFPGGASTALQTRVRQDLEATLAFFRTQYGIQANPDFTIYAAKDVDALLQAWKDDGQGVEGASEASIHALWSRVSGWADSNIIIKQSSWPDDLATDEIPRGRYVITHEYFHILQRQLSDGRTNQWLTEGTASWVDSEHAVFDGQQTWEGFRDGLLSAIASDTPTLRSAESENSGWEYTLGQLATDRLTANTNPDFPIEFWRQLAPTKIGPHGRWRSTPDWRTVFHRASGQPMSEFYADFDAWQREQAATNATTPNSYEYDGNWIHGSVTNESGAPAAGVFVNAIRVERETSVGWNQRAETNAEGLFAVQAPKAGDYHLSVDISDDCTRYYSGGQLNSDGDQWNDREEARTVKVNQADVSGIDIRLPPNVCGWQIRGRAIGPNAEPLPGIRVSLSTMGHGFPPKLTAHDGSFALPAEAGRGSYRLALVLTEPPTGGDGCSMSYKTEIANEDVQVGLLRVPEGTCAYIISGRFVDSSGAPLSEKWINLHGTGSSYGVSTNANGHFQIRAPADGAYTFSTELRSQPYCWHHLDGQALGSPNNPVRVSGADVTNITLRLPDTIEELCE